MIVSIRLIFVLLIISFNLNELVLSQNNLLINGGFDFPFNNPQTIPNWIEIPTSPAENVFLQDFGCDSDNCLFIGAINDLAGVQQQVNQLNPATQYPIFFSLLAVGSTNQFRVISQCDATPQQILLDLSNVPDTQGTFVRHNTSLSTPSASRPVACNISFVGVSANNGNFILDSLVLNSASLRGDPAFVGFLGQSYQVHGIPGRIFNLISTANVQVNALFEFLGNGDVMTADEMASYRSRLLQHNLPVTSGWVHDGTYLGKIACQFKTKGSITRVKLEAGTYTTGVRSIELDGRSLNVSSPSTLVRVGDVMVKLVSSHVVEIRTSQLRLLIVNSDRFFNIESASLSPMLMSAPYLIEGVLGQSADPSRYFPNSRPSEHASGDVKKDWQEHQVMDYLIADNNIWSREFTLNLFDINK